MQPDERSQGLFLKFTGGVQKWHFANKTRTAFRRFWVEEHPSSRKKEKMCKNVLPSVVARVAVPASNAEPETFTAAEGALLLYYTPPYRGMRLRRAR